MQGRICEGSNNFFVVECDDGITRLCSLKGKKLPSAERYYNPLAPGDFVQVLIDNLDNKAGQITELIERKNAYLRWNVKGRLPQLLAANLDYLFCVTTPQNPPFRARFIDRMLIQADEQKIQSFILLNKCDNKIPADCENQLKIWQDCGYTVIKISAKTGEGMQEMTEFLANHLCAFAGQSGVGKSTIINRLDDSMNIRTGNLCEKYDRGSHTTTKGVLHHIKINSNFTKSNSNVFCDIIDTPGIRRFVLHDIKAEDLIYNFPEMAPLVGTCGFGMSCSHTHEKNCAILHAVEKGRVSSLRYESWQRVKEEIETDSWLD
ncbi:MAG: ribosome small subunit-dependent GTPase A [Treponemataceae bacterium]